MESLRESRLRTSFTEPKAISGVDFKLFTINVAVAVFMVISFRLWQWLPLTVVAHFFLKNITQKDSDALDVYVRYSKQCNRYEPWPMVGQMYGRRPVGFARGRPC